MTKNGNEIKITDSESMVCKICNKKFDSNRKMIWHVRKTHQLNFEQYIIQSFYNGVKPVCLKTGKSLSFKAHKLGPWFSNFSKNSFPRKPHTDETKKKIKNGCEKVSMEKFGVKNVFSTDWCKKKIKQTMISKYGVENIMQLDDVKEKVLISFFETIKNRPKKEIISSKYDSNKTSSLEKDLQNKLTEMGIEFISPFYYNGKRYDLMIPKIKVVVEIDGDAFHKNTLEKLTLITVNGSVNDFNKNIIIEKSDYDFYRIRYSPESFVLDDENEIKNVLKSHSYVPNYNLEYHKKVVNKEYFKKFIALYGKDKLKKYLYLFLKFIRTFQPELPIIDLKENLVEVINKISKADISKIYNPQTKEFSNNISSIGHNYLKHYFRSYWKSRFKGNLSPEEAWKNDKIMKRIIEYRIGCNESNEVFDFSLHQLVRGLSAQRITISFFKPLLAAAIYKHYLGEKNDPVVLDPCCGFGGRMLGFKSVYPNGTYIGCEPNKETYNELIELKTRSGWNNVIIHNCRFEDYRETLNVDLTFTSIPYFDREIYSNNGDVAVYNYQSIDEWKNTFILALEKCQNCYINVPVDLSEILGWNIYDSYIISNRSHFDDKTKEKKKEVIVKIN